MTPDNARKAAREIRSLTAWTDELLAAIIMKHAGAPVVRRPVAGYVCADGDGVVVCGDGSVFYARNGVGRWESAPPIPGTPADTSVEVEVSNG